VLARLRQGLRKHSSAPHMTHSEEVLTVEKNGRPDHGACSETGPADMVAGE
jgi:hypothetical protein